MTRRRACRVPGMRAGRATLTALAMARPQSASVLEKTDEAVRVQFELECGTSCAAGRRAPTRLCVWGEGSLQYLRTLAGFYAQARGLALSSERGPPGKTKCVMPCFACVAQVRGVDSVRRLQSAGAPRLALHVRGLSTKKRKEQKSCGALPMEKISMIRARIISFLAAPARELASYCKYA